MIMFVGLIDRILTEFYQLLEDAVDEENISVCQVSSCYVAVIYSHL